MESKKILEELNKLYNDPTCPLDYKKDYELVLAVMLSCQSTDKTVNKVTPSLKELSTLPNEKLEQIIKPVGTYKRKADYIKKITKALLENNVNFNDRTFLESLPGIGRKCSNVILSELYGENVIAVDTHILRISKRLGIASKDDDALKVEEKLTMFFEPYSFPKLHLLLLYFGRDICKAKNPLCDKCPFYPCKKDSLN